MWERPPRRSRCCFHTPEKEAGMAKRGSGQPKIGKLKSASPAGRTQPKAGTIGTHARRILSQPALGGKRRSR